jgi:hypothetical protein
VEAADPADVIGPTMDRMLSARAHIGTMQAHIAQVLTAYGCAQHEGPEDCNAAEEQGCYWDAQQDRCRASGNENDALAIPILLAAQSKLNAAADELNLAIDAFPSLAYLLHVGKVCVLAHQVRANALSGRQAALLPIVGAITPADFDLILVETNAMRADLGCP